MSKKFRSRNCTIITMICFLSLAFCLLIPANTMASSSYWIGGAGGEGDWNWAANWTSGIPVTNQQAFIGDDATGANWSKTVYYTETPTYASGEAYVLAGLNMTARDGNGVALHHSAGTLTLGTNSTLTVTGLNGGYAEYHLKEEAVLVKQGYEVLVGTGLDSSGAFVQTGGTFRLNGGMYIGTGEYGSESSNSSGSYYMEDGIIDGWTDDTGITNYGSIVLGEWGAFGQFDQFGGAVTLSDITLARQVGSSGTYYMEDGSLTLTTSNGSSGRMLVGGAGTGLVEQRGGMITAQQLTVGGTHLIWDGEKYSDSVAGSGEYQIDADSTLLIHSDMIVGDGGQGAFYQTDGSVTVDGSLILGAVAYNGDPDLEQAGSGVYSISGGTLDAGKIEIASGSEFIFDGGSVNFSELMNNGNFRGNITSSGMLSGSGTVNGNVTSTGIIAPGSSPGTLTIDGDLAMEAGSTLEIELSGTDDGEFDQLAVTGNVTLAGILNLSLFGDYTPSDQAYYDILSAGTITGSLVLNEMPDNWVWELTCLDLTNDGEFDTLRLTANAVPVPAASLLFGTGLLWVAYRSRKPY